MTIFAWNQADMKIIFATNNNHKLREIRPLLPAHIELLIPADLSFKEEIPESGDTLESNALMKARYLFQLFGIPAFADDTGLEIESLDGAPGVRSARFAGEDKNSDRNIEKALTLLKTSNDRKARFRTVIALVTANDTHLFEGIINGTITREKRGHKGFGYDPIFQPEGSNLTFAEMSLTEKNTISHRAQAFSKLAGFLAEKSQIQ